MNIDAFISIVAGLGLFVIGIKGLAANMGQLTGRRMREWVARSTGNYLMSALIGVFSGALTQSTNAITVILMSLAKADLITPRNARPILAWANIGTAALVMAAAVDVHVAVLGLVSLAGICFYLNLDRSPRWRLFVSALFSVSILFLGLGLMRDGSQMLRNLEWVRLFFAFSAQWMESGFVVGLALALVTQSSATVTVIAMAMTAAGLLNLEQAMITVYGASLGSGFSTYMVATSMTGKARQLAVMQVMVKLLGVAVLVPLLALERAFGLPLIAHGLRAMSADPGQQVALVYLAVQIVSVLAQEGLNKWVQSLVELASPPSVEENLASPKFLYRQALGDPETALTLVDREQHRVFALLPLYLGLSDHWDTGDPVPDGAAVLPIARSLCTAIEYFLQNLADSGASREALETIASRQARNSLLLSIHESVDEIATSLRRRREFEAMKALNDNLLEGLGALLLTAEETVRTLDPGDLAILRHLTGDRDSLVDSMRQRVMATDRILTREDQQMLYGITSLFERIVWLLRRYGTLLTPRPRPQREPAAAYLAESPATASS